MEVTKKLDGHEFYSPVKCKITLQNSMDRDPLLLLPCSQKALTIFENTKNIHQKVHSFNAKTQFNSHAVLALHLFDPGSILDCLNIKYDID